MASKWPVSVKAAHFGARMLKRRPKWASKLAPKWAALTLTVCTQHCVPVSHLRVPHQNSTSTCFSTVFQVSSCLTHLLKARTVHTDPRALYIERYRLVMCTYELFIYAQVPLEEKTLVVHHHDGRRARGSVQLEPIFETACESWMVSFSRIWSFFSFLIIPVPGLDDGNKGGAPCTSPMSTRSRRRSTNH